MDGDDASLFATEFDVVGTEDNDFQYNQTVFSMEGLTQGLHTVVGTVLLSDGPVLFDYAVYTYAYCYPEDSPQLMVRFL